MFKNRPAINSRPPQEAPKSRTGSSSPTPTSSSRAAGDVYHLRDAVQQKLLSEAEGEVNQAHLPQMRQMIEVLYNQVLADENLLYTRADRAQILDWITSDILGFGPLEPLLKDPAITEIMVNGPKTIYIERYGLIDRTDVVFENDSHLMRIIDRIVSPLGRRVDESSPMVDARLPNGYRINATIPPLSLDGPLLTIRKFAQTPFTAQDMIANGTLTSNTVAFLNACIQARINIVVSGGTGSGKTTLLNVISGFIPSDERIITIEDTAELQLNQEHVLRLEKRPPNVEGRGEITIRQLVINALRMRPDRIIVGESRGGEALDMLQAMNTGHDGSMTTVHSNTPRDTLRRIETMVLMAGIELPMRAIREQIASAIDLVIHMDRLRDGTRRVVQITEVQGMEGDNLVMQDLFIFDQVGIFNGRVVGNLKGTGLRPSFSDKFAVNNIHLAPDLFDSSTIL